MMDKKNWIYWAVPVFLLAILLWWKLPIKKKKGITTQTKVAYVVGKVDACARNPTFPTKEGLQPPYLIDLRQFEEPGLRIIEARKKGKVLKRKEWGAFGTLGPYTLDKNGVIYTAPIPFVSLRDRPPSFYNKLLSVNSETGEMGVFMHLPNPQSPTKDNPFGIVGMTYDCSNHSIYVTSLGGSNATDEVGRIFHIDLKSKKILHMYEGFDAIGVGVFTMKSGKRLYLGSARSPEVFSIQLTLAGGFVSDPRFEFSLAGQEGGSFDTAHRIRFLNGNRMKVKGIEFSYSLMAASDPQRNIYMFDYDPEKDAWKFDETHPQ